MSRLKVLGFFFKLGVLGLLWVSFSCSESKPKAVAQEPVEETVAVEKEKEPEEEEPVINFSLDYVMGKFDPAKHEDFEVIATEHADRAGLYLRKDAYADFKRMHEAAKKDGIRLTIRSAARNFNVQKTIWEGKWTGSRKIENGKDASKAYPVPKTRALKILEYSSMPSTSRHHWGTDIDLNSFENSYFESGKGLKEYQWLSAHAAEYGFCQVYTEKDEKRPNGYNLEKWHWSYLPIATQLTQLAKQQLKDEMIQGFKGSETAVEIGVVEKYVLGINRRCIGH